VFRVKVKKEIDVLPEEFHAKAPRSQRTWRRKKKNFTTNLTDLYLRYTHEPVVRIFFLNHKYYLFFNKDFL